MEIDFNQLRRNIATDFNDLTYRIKFLDLGNDLANEVNTLRSSIGGLLACYDNEQGFEDLSDIDLLEIPE
jgi:hypothetical protein